MPHHVIMNEVTHFDSVQRDVIAPSAGNVITNTNAADNDKVLDDVNKFKQLFSKTDKTTRHGYHWLYGRWFPQYKFKKDLAILEIGSRRGDSALAWSNYFGPHVDIDMISYGGQGDTMKFNNPTIGCMRNNNGEINNEGCGRIHTFYCDQSDANKLEREVVAERPKGWDIVIDDGSHVPAHNIISFEVLWKKVRPGGIYIVEDIETSYYEHSEVYGYEYEAGILAPSPLNALNRFRQYADIINRGYIGPNGRKYSLFEGDGKIMEIGYARNVIFIRKALEGKDIGGHGYEDYPIGMVKSRGFGDINTQEALAIFKEQSKDLEKWRPKNGTL